MKLHLTRIACLLPFILSACAHKNQAVNQPALAPPIEDTPLPAPSNAPKDLPPTVVSNPQPTPSTASTQTQAPPKPVPKHKKPKPAPAQAAASANSTQSPSDPAKLAPPLTTQEASNGGTEVSAIGKLSSGEPADLRTQTVNSLTSTENSLKAITRPLNDQQEKTAAQIRAYLKEAHAALDSNDLDGARTLATKAKLLLNELTQ